MSREQLGNPFKAEVVSADASSGVAATIYLAGSTSAYTPKSTERLSITDIAFVSTAGGTYNLVAAPQAGPIVDGAGLRLVKGNADALGGIVKLFETPLTLPAGYIPALIAVAGQVDLIISGFITSV
jgi:hypothetical protein